MTLIELFKLARELRKAQRHYYRLDPHTDREKKIEALVSAKILERQLDQVIDDFERGEELERIQVKPAAPWKKP